MDNDVLDTGGTPPAGGNAGGTPPAPTGVKFKCVFCDCVMTGDGKSIWSMGERAKIYDESEKKHAKAITVKEEEIAKLNQEISALKQERDALRGSPAASRRVGQRVS